MSYGDLILWLFGGLIPLGATGFMLARSKALGTESDGGRLHSRPGYYGWYGVIWLAIPALLSGLLFSVAHLFGLFSIPAPMLLATMLGTGGAGLWYALSHISIDFRA
ncbi:MAG: phosphate ABC transporter permease family protein, partial [Mariprofundus sp.]